MSYLQYWILGLEENPIRNVVIEVDPKLSSRIFLTDYQPICIFSHPAGHPQRPNNGELGTHAGILNGTEGGGQGKGLRSWSTLRAASQICIPALKPAGHARSARINVEEK